VEPRPLSHFLHILGHRTLLVATKKTFSCPKYKFHFEKVVVTVTIVTYKVALMALLTTATRQNKN